MIEILQLILLIVLVDRSLLLRDRYKIAIENNERWFAIWIYCKQKNENIYHRYGGKKLFIYKKKTK